MSIKKISLFLRKIVYNYHLELTYYVFMHTSFKTGEIKLQKN